MTTLKKMQENARKKLQGYWYYAGCWHIAECDFILADHGVCNCNTRKNIQEINNIIKHTAKEK